MNKSESINELALALSKLQGEVTDAHKGKKGYGYNYADLGSVLEISRPLLVKHGLAVTQLCGTEGDKITVETVLMHSSGQWISSVLAFASQAAKGMTAAQAAGSVITYMRRYALTAALGITQTDDDGACREEPVLNLVTAETLQTLRGYILSMDVTRDALQTMLLKAGIKTLEELTEAHAQYWVKLFKQREEQLYHEEQQQHQGDNMDA